MIESSPVKTDEFSYLGRDGLYYKGYILSNDLVESFDMFSGVAKELEKHLMEEYGITEEELERLVLASQANFGKGEVWFELIEPFDPAFFECALCGHSSMTVPCKCFGKSGYTYTTVKK